MNRSVVIHHCTAWWHSHWTTCLGTAGSVARHRSDRGGKRMAGASPAGRGCALAQLPPDQKAVGKHHRSGMTVEARPQPPLVLIPPQLPFGLFMELFNGIPPMGIARQLFPRDWGGQMAPLVLPFLRLAARGPLAQQPAHMLPLVAGHAPAVHRHKLLVQPPCGAVAQADGPPPPA